MKWHEGWNLFWNSLPIKKKEEKESEKEEEREKGINDTNILIIVESGEEIQGLMIWNVSLLLLMFEIFHSIIYAMNIYKIWNLCHFLHSGLNHVSTLSNLEVWLCQWNNLEFLPKYLSKTELPERPAAIYIQDKKPRLYFSVQSSIRWLLLILVLTVFSVMC